MALGGAHHLADEALKSGAAAAIIPDPAGVVAQLASRAVMRWPRPGPSAVLARKALMWPSFLASEPACLADYLAALDIASR